MRSLMDFPTMPGGLLAGEPQPEMSPLFAMLTNDRPQQPPVNTMPPGPADPFDRYNDPWGEVPRMMEYPFGLPPLGTPPEPPALKNPPNRQPWWFTPRG